MSGAHPSPHSSTTELSGTYSLTFESFLFVIDIFIPLSTSITFIYDDQLVDVFSRKVNRSFMATPIKIGTMVSYTT